jgi:outer membrane protein assembly factor BamD (BamD/ComL family)
MPTSVLRDRAQMRIAEVYERLLKDNVKAVEAYERLLEQFPTSLFVEEARKRIRALRGEVL